MNTFKMKSLILSLFLIFSLFQNASADVIPPVFDIPVHDAVASIEQKLRSSDAFLLVYVNTQTIEFSIPTTSSEIRIYSSKGVMVGHNNFYFENSTTGTVWVTLDALDMVEGEVFTMMFWNSVNQTEQELTVTWNATQSYSLYPLDCKYYYASDLFTEKVVFKQPTELVSIIEQEALNIYPNPAFNVVNITLPDNGMNLASEIDLVNLDGKLIKKFSLIDVLEGNVQLDVHDVPIGVYLIQAKSVTVTYSQKIVISH